MEKRRAQRDSIVIIREGVARKYWNDTAHISRRRIGEAVEGEAAAVAAAGSSAVSFPQFRIMISAERSDEIAT